MLRTYIISLITLLCTVLNTYAQAPTLTTKGGVYELITDANQLQANDIVIIASHGTIDGEDKVRIMANPLSNGYFSFQTGDDIQNNTMPNHIAVKDVNSGTNVYEYLVENLNSGKKDNKYEFQEFYLKNIENNYIYKTGSTNNTLKLVTSSSKTKVNIINHPDYDNILLSFTSGSLFICFNGTGFSNFAKITGTKSFLYRKLQTETITISSVGYATLYYKEKDVVLPEGLSAYTFKYDDKNNQLVATHNFKPGETIPQATAVILNAKAGDYEITLTTPSGESTDYSDINSLKGTDEETTLPSSGNSYYVLNNVAGKPTFCLASDDYTYHAHKAYLALPISAQQAKNTTFLLPNLGGNDITALPVVTNEPNDTPTAPTITYDLLGRQLPHSTTTPGVKIVNGKKVAIQH